MTREYLPLPLHPLRPGSRFLSLDQQNERVQMNSSALAVMTDLRKTPAATIDAGAPLDAANRFMIRRAVRMLLVTDDERRVIGLISSSDILGEKPVRFALEAGLCRRDLRVGDIMSPQQQLDALVYDDVVRAEVGHVVSTLRRTGRQHALVCERGVDGGESVRGIFSLSQIARQLGVAIQTTEIAQTFAEIEAALGR